MPNQNDNKIEALRIEAEYLNTLIQEHQKKVDSFTAYVARTTKDEEVEVVAEEVEVVVEEVEEVEDENSMLEQDLLEFNLEAKANEEALAKQAEIEAQQAELIDKIATFEAEIEGHNSIVKGIREDKKALQKRSEAEQDEVKKKEAKLKRVRANLAALGDVISETYDNGLYTVLVNGEERIVNTNPEPDLDNVTQLREFKQPNTENPDYHVGAPGADLSPDWADKYRDRRGNRGN